MGVVSCNATLDIVESPNGITLSANRSLQQSARLMGNPDLDCVKTCRLWVPVQGVYSGLSDGAWEAVSRAGAGVGKVG